jgi:tRNA pseudouridine65 synthase
MSHIFHPIIGDRPHGCNKQNKLWKEQWNFTNMLLHAKTLSFKNPENDNPLKIMAPLTDEFKRALNILNLDHLIKELD